METYKDKLAPWEKRNAYYNDVKLGRKVNDMKAILKDKTEAMVAAQTDSAEEIVVGLGVTEDVLQELDYDIKSVGQGMSGLKAAFEWGISDVVWCIEKRTEELQGVMMDIYKVPDGKMDQLRHNADDAFARGDMAEAMELFDDIESMISDDFSVCVSYGMIYLFHKIDKEKALAYFDKAVKYVRPYSEYYTSYALLYKALINRDLGFIEEAERCANEAVSLSPGFAEARYQNAQYNALLNRPEKAIPLLKKAIKEDIVYCLKILWERDFQQISSEIAELYEEIRDEKNEQIKEALGETKKNVIKLTTVAKGIKKLGYDVPTECSVELLEEGNSEIGNLVKNNSIFDAHYAGILLPLLSKKYTRQTDVLRGKGNEIYINLDRQIQDLSVGMKGKKKKGGTVPFLIHFLCGQIVALPFGWYIGVPLGICITEALLLAICFYINVIQPQSQWKDISAKESEKNQIERVVKKL